MFPTAFTLLWWLKLIGFFSNLAARQWLKAPVQG